jgi:WD40 repeat protein
MKCAIRLFALLLIAFGLDASATAQAEQPAPAAANPPIEIVPKVAHSDKVWTLAYSPNGRILASGSQDDTIKLWDAATGRLMRTIDVDFGLVKSIAFLPDGQSFVSGTYGVHLWDTISGRLLRKFDDDNFDYRSV